MSTISASRPDATKQGRTVLPLLLMVYLPPFILLAIVAIASNALGVEIERFTRDPAAISDTHPLLGVVSNLGVVLVRGDNMLSADMEDCCSTPNATT